MIATDLHADTLRIIELLDSTPRGDIVALDDISAYIDRDIRRCRHLLYSALRFMEREQGAVWACVRGAGYRRLSPDEIVKIGQTARARIRGYARRGARSMEAGMQGANDLPNETKKKILAEQSSLGLLEHLSRDKSVPLVSDDQQRPLPVATTARAFLQSIGAKL